MQLSAKLIREYALTLGFDDIGFVKPYPLSKEVAFFQNYLQKGFQGEMSYLERNLEKRMNPLLLLPNALTMMVGVLSYNVEDADKRCFASDVEFARHEKGKFEDCGSSVLQGVSSYARGKDYHGVIKKMLKNLLKKLPPCNSFLSVDTSPLAEKIWAQKAGLGWLGKNSLLIHPTLGSKIFIGVLLCDLEMDHYNEELMMDCGNCNACVKACPTSALSEIRGVVGCKCWSYWTVECQGVIPMELASKTKKFWYGCDICQDVCPANAGVFPKKQSEFTPHIALRGLSKAEWLEMKQEDFQEYFKDSPIKRIGMERMKENIKAF